MLIKSGPDVTPPTGPLLSRANNFAALRSLLTKEYGDFAEETLYLGNDYAKITLRPEMGRGGVEFVAVAGDFLIVISELDFFTDCAFRYVGEDWIRFNFNLQGSSSLLFDGRDSARIERQTSHLMIHPEGVVHSDVYFGRTHGRWVSILCRKERLTEVLGFDPEAFPAALSRFLGDGTPSLYLNTRPINLAMCRVIGEFFHRPPVVALRPLYLKAKAYEALYAFLDGYAADTASLRGPGRLTRRDVERLYEARDILVREPSIEVALARLARRLGLNRSKLSQGFHALFGTTILDFTRTQRLTAARDLLRDTDLTVSQISDRCGYRHVSTFSAAFKLQFGISPCEARKGGDNVESDKADLSITNRLPQED